MNRLSRLALGLLSISLALPPAVRAADYTADLAHSQVGFSIRHLVSKVRGHFHQYDVTLKYDPTKVEASKVEAVIQTATIDTANEKRDEHLRTPDFFDVLKHPTMTYKSRSVKRTGATRLLVEGDLTLLGVTKPVTLDVEEGGSMKDPWGNTKTGFIATAKINRKDFGMVWNTAIDTGGYILGDEVEINLEMELQPAAPAKAK